MDIGALLRNAETDAEKLSAAVRLVIFLALAVAILSASQGQRPADSILMVLALYGLGTGIGLVLAWRGIFNPAVPYLFVTFDVILVSAQLLMLTGLMSMGSSFAFALPIAGLAFVILIHASLRYRPWLIVYAAVLFLLAMNLGSAFFTLEGGMDHGMADHSMASMGEGQSMGALMNFQTIPVVLIALAAFILFVLSRRTRALLLRSIAQANRAAKLSRFFSPNLANSLAEGDDEQLLAGRQLVAAVLFVDIRGFTALGESMSPQDLSEFLSEYRSRLTKLIFAKEGTVDKFIGDGIMAVFGTPVQRADDARRAIACALEIIAAMKSWSAERKVLGRSPVAAGIGVHYGSVFAGALGDEQLLEYTVIGDTVNVAERLERLSRDVGSPLVVSAAILRAAGEAGHMRWQHLPPQELKGHSKPIDVCCLVEDRSHEILDVQKLRNQEIKQ